MLRRLVAPALALALVLAVILAVMAPVRAQDEEVLAPPAIIVVDFQSVVRRSAAVRSIQDQINELRRGYQEEFGRIEEDLRATEAELTDQRPGMVPEAFMEQRRAFEERVIEAQREAQARRTALDEALNQAMDEVRTALLEIVADIAGERGADLVLDRSQVVLVDHGLEVSEEALVRLDERLPTVQVRTPPQPLPASPPPAAEE